MISDADGLYDPDQVRELFDRMSASYDRMNIVMSFGLSVRWRRQMLHLIGADRMPGTVLDMMSGRGETWSEIGRRYPASDIIAIDFSERMAEQSSARNRAVHGGRVTILCEDALFSSIPDSSVDVIVSAYGLKTFDAGQSERLADEVARILRPGGEFVFIDVTEPPNRVLRLGYRLYLRWIVPVAGMLLLSDPTEYRMLHRYLSAYGDGARSVEAFAQQPSLRSKTRAHFFGCATSISGRRLDGADVGGGG